MNETKSIWVAYSNTDCTEGRGHDFPIATCILETTALRLARNSYVQGSDGPVRRVDILKIDSEWYVPTRAIRLIGPTQADQEEQDKLDKRREIIRKAKAAGLTDNEINLLKD